MLLKRISDRPPRFTADRRPHNHLRQIWEDCQAGITLGIEADGTIKGCPSLPTPGQPFDHEIFALIEEPANVPWPAEDALRFRAANIQWTRCAPAAHFPILR